MASVTPCGGLGPTTSAGWALDAVISQVKRADAAIQHATRLADEGHHHEAVRATAQAQQLFEFARNSAINLALAFEGQQQIQPAGLKAHLHDRLLQHWVPHSGLHSSEPQQHGGGDPLFGTACASAVGYGQMLAAGLAAAAAAAADDTEGEPEVTSRMRPHS